MNPHERYLLWCHSPLVSRETKAELLSLQDQPKEIEDRFYQELSFGTAGLRGILGAGDNRMNVYNVRKATQGLAQYLLSLPQGSQSTVAIAYDSRHCSQLFAQETACVLAAHGIRVYLFDTIHAVPQLSFTLRYLKCTAGVVITASHNPAKYNGYKVYWGDGGQVNPLQAEAITGYIRQVKDFETVGLPLDKAVEQGLVQYIGAEVDESYYAATMSLLSDREGLKEAAGELKLVYTPLHGAGFVPVTTILGRMGLKQLYVVKEQSAPDGSFPTVAAPNPEDPNAFTLAMALAEEKGAELILATDPDSDRLGLALKKQDGSWAVLSGNQIACILLYSLLKEKQDKGTLPPKGLVVRSMVSTPLADAICRHFHVTLREVLTGFRFISQQIDNCDKTGESFLFGFEESFGYLAGGFSRDKDAICSAMLVSQAAIRYKQRGMNLYDALQEVYTLFGFYGEKALSYTLEGKEGIEKIKAAMESLRQSPPARIGAVAVTDTLDYMDSQRTGLPENNTLCFCLEGDRKLLARPSGTEPKLKLYLMAKGDSQQALEDSLRQLETAVQALLKPLL